MPAAGGRMRYLHRTMAIVLAWSLSLTPILYYVNGPSVSTDQAVVRAALVVLSALGAVVLRVVNWRRARRP